MTIDRILRSAALLLAAWIPVLILSLVRSDTPATTGAGWVTLDLAELVGLVLTARAVALRSDALRLVAPVTALLLLVDAIVDTSGAATRTAFDTAVLMAVFAELPLAALCAVIGYGAITTATPSVQAALPRPRWMNDVSRPSTIS